MIKKIEKDAKTKRVKNYLHFETKTLQRRFRYF